MQDHSHPFLCKSSSSRMYEWEIYRGHWKWRWRAVMVIKLKDGTRVMAGVNEWRRCWWWVGVGLTKQQSRPKQHAGGEFTQHHNRAQCNTNTTVQTASTTTSSSQTTTPQFSTFAFACLPLFPREGAGEKAEERGDGRKRGCESEREGDPFVPIGIQLSKNRFFCWLFLVLPAEMAEKQLNKRTNHAPWGRGWVLLYPNWMNEWVG